QGNAADGVERARAPALRRAARATRRVTLSHDADEPIYVIGVAARLVRLHPQSLRYYERIGLVVPARPRGKLRMDSRRDVARLRPIQRLVRDLGVNLAGVEVIMRMVEEMRRQAERHSERRRELEAELDRLRALLDL